MLPQFAPSAVALLEQQMLFNPPPDQLLLGTDHFIPVRML